MRQIYSDYEVRQALRDAEIALREISIAAGKRASDKIGKYDGSISDLIAKTLVGTFCNEETYQVMKIEKLLKMIEKMYG
jgi:hypothetical protein